MFYIFFGDQGCQIGFDYGEGSEKSSGVGERGFEALASRVGVVEEESQAGVVAW